MGRWRRANWRRRKQRDKTPAQEQLTLVPCPACVGTGKVYRTDPLTWALYPRACPWCLGTGGIDRVMLGLYARWAGIAHANRCQAKLRR